MLSQEYPVSQVESRFCRPFLWFFRRWFSIHSRELKTRCVQMQFYDPQHTLRIEQIIISISFDRIVRTFYEWSVPISFNSSLVSSLLNAKTAFWSVLLSNSSPRVSCQYRTDFSKLELARMTFCTESTARKEIGEVWRQTVHFFLSPKSIALDFWRMPAG